MIIRIKQKLIVRRLDGFIISVAIPHLKLLNTWILVYVEKDVMAEYRMLPPGYYENEVLG